jgi:hypothetical protein
MGAEVYVLTTGIGDIIVAVGDSHALCMLRRYQEHAIDFNFSWLFLADGAATARRQSNAYSRD